MLKHSPGPWMHIDGLVLAADGSEVCRMIGTNSAKGPKGVTALRGNKVLVSNAPALYQVLINLFNTQNSLMDRADALHAADVLLAKIAKDE